MGGWKVQSSMGKTKLKYKIIIQMLYWLARAEKKLPKDEELARRYNDIVP